MLAPSPRVAGIEYRTAYGFTLFDCTKLRASLSPSNCADNFQQRRCLACKDCVIGAVHSGKPPPTHVTETHRPTVCVRCGTQSPRRLVAGSWCLSCYNRSLEAVSGRNGKGQYPRMIAADLHMAYAILHGNDLMAGFYPTVHAGKHNLPRLSRIDRCHCWLEAIVTGEAELQRLLQRRLPDAGIVASEIKASFSHGRDATLITLN